MKDQNIEHCKIPLKCSFPDIYSDLIVIASAAIQIWGKDVIDRHYCHELDWRLKEYRSRISNEVSHQTRLYLTTEFFWPCLVVPNPSERTINITKTNAGVRQDALFENLIAAGPDCFMLWIFEKDRLDSRFAVTSTMAAELLTAFSPENLISLAHLRPHWYLP